MGCGSSTGTNVIASTNGNMEAKGQGSTDNLKQATNPDQIHQENNNGTLISTNQGKVQSSDKGKDDKGQSSNTADDETSSISEVANEESKDDVVEEEMQGDGSDNEDNKDKESEKKLTPEEEHEKLEEKISNIFEKMKESWKSLDDTHLLIDAETGLVTAKYRNIAYSTFSTHFKLKPYSFSVRHAYKRNFCQLMVAQDVIPKFCDMTVYMLKHGYMNEDGTKVDMNTYKPLVNTFTVLVNFTDNKIKRADIVADHPEFLPYIAEYLQSVTEQHLAGEESPQVSKITYTPILICHNIAMQQQNVDRMRTLGFVDVMKPFMNSPSEKVRLAAVATLADIVDEKQSEIIRADDRVMVFIKKCLDKAMLMKMRTYLGWSTTELARTVRRIALNDSNKSALVQHGILSSLVKLSRSKKVLEQKEAVRTMWTLSFDEGNQDAMISDNECEPIDAFIRLSSSPAEEIRKICDGALWTMRTKLAESEKYREIGEKYCQNKTDSSEKPGKEEGKSEGHIMISYQWGHQELLKKVRDQLLASGFQVWMDIDDMEGSTLEAMARAVENAEVVLICFSEKYKNSDNCRAEAEYAFQKKKKIIPLKVEMNYRPDGWLGFIIGAKLFFDFGGKYTFESRIEGLVKELNSKTGKDTLPVADKVNVPAPGKPSASPMEVPVSQPVNSGALFPHMVPVTRTTVESVRKWTDKDVEKWMVKHSLDTQNIKKLTGVEVAFLMMLKVECPEFFYRTITEKLKITDLLVVAQFRFALDETSL